MCQVSSLFPMIDQNLFEAYSPLTLGILFIHLNIPKIQDN